MPTTPQNPGAGRALRFILTARDTADRLAEKESIGFVSGVAAGRDALALDPQLAYQSIEGFGGAFTEAAAHALSRVSPERREEALRAYFDPVVGHRYSFCRTHINSCDFSLGNYAFNDVAGDYELRHFDISRDRERLIPMIRDALKISGSGFRLFASPWSPPAWMKTNGEMNNGGRLKKDCLDVWARYFARFIKAYAKEGIPIWGVTVQNEPAASQRWDSCLYDAEEERDFVKCYLGPRLAAEGLGQVKIIIWDHNKDIIVERASMVLTDAVAAGYVWGTGFHWYGGDHFEKLDRVHHLFPDKKLISTENGQEGGVTLGAWALGERYGHSIIGDLNHWAAGWVDWNMVLDARGGPNHAGNYCDAPIIADEAANALHYQSAYYYLGHFSRFIAQGARRIGLRAAGRVPEATAFRNPDGELVVVAMNSKDEPSTFSLSLKDETAAVALPARSIATLLL